MTPTFARTMASCLDPVQFCRAGGFEPDELFQTQRTPLPAPEDPLQYREAARQVGHARMEGRTHGAV